MALSVIWLVLTVQSSQSLGERIKQPGPLEQGEGKQWLDYLKSVDGGDMSDAKATATALEILQKANHPTLEEVKTFSNFLQDADCVDWMPSYATKWALDMLATNHGAASEFKAWSDYLDACSEDWPAKEWIAGLLAKVNHPTVEEFKSWFDYIYNVVNIEPSADARAKALETLAKDHPSLEDVKTWTSYLHSENGGDMKMADAFDEALDVLGKDRHPSLKDLRTWSKYFLHHCGGSFFRTFATSHALEILLAEDHPNFEEFAAWSDYFCNEGDYGWDKTQQVTQKTLDVLKKHHPTFEEFKIWKGLLHGYRTDDRIIEMLTRETHPTVEEFKALSSYIGSQEGMYGEGEEEALSLLTTAHHPSLEQVKDWINYFVNTRDDETSRSWAVKRAIQFLQKEGRPSEPPKSLLGRLTFKAWCKLHGI